MNPLETYQQAKRELQQFNAWASLIGKEYFGGTRGKGCEYGSVVSATGSLTIYYQESDGAKNYHDSSQKVNGHIAKAMIEHQAAILASVRRQLEEELQTAKQEAANLAAELTA